MLRLPFLALAFGLLAGQLIPASAAQDSFPARYLGQIEAMRKRHRIPGLVVALVNRDRVLWCQGFGQRSGHDGAPVGPSTIYSVQSVSKAVTATAVMLAAQERLVDLDAPIIEYLPGFTINSCFEEHPERRITLRLLLAHAAGLTHEPPVGNNYDPGFPSIEDHNRSIRETWLNSPVGSRYFYSNNGYDLAAEVVASTSGLHFSDYVRNRLFLPLGMLNSTLDPETFSQHNDRTYGHAIGLSKIPDAMPFPGAGSLYASAEDLARFVMFHLNLGRAGGKQLLKQGLLCELYRPVITSGYGLGLAIIDQSGRLVFNHNGGGFGWGASMTWYPQYGIGCVVLANAQTNADLYGLTVTILDDWVGRSAQKSDFPPLPFDPLALGKRIATRSVKRPPCPGETTYQVKWSRYVGTYKHLYGKGFVWTWYARLARWLGYRIAKLQVERRGEGLFFRLDYGGGYGDWQRLSEYRPGLFFTEYGEALDFNRSPPTYRNIQLER